MSHQKVIEELRELRRATAGVRVSPMSSPKRPARSKERMEMYKYIT
jgi:hypothetical protein